MNQGLAACYVTDDRRSSVTLTLSAIARGLWGNTYAATDVEEYWAEGVQGWFDTNATALPTNGIHNHVGTRAALQSYDIQLADILTEVFPTDWRYSCP